MPLGFGSGRRISFPIFLGMYASGTAFLAVIAAINRSRTNPATAPTIAPTAKRTIFSVSIFRLYQRGLIIRKFTSAADYNVPEAAGNAPLWVVFCLSRFRSAPFSVTSRRNTSATSGANCVPVQ